MYTPQEKQPDPQQERRIRLEMRKQPPTHQDLRWLLAEAEKVQGRRVELPWLICGGEDCMILIAEYTPQNGQPSWMLYRGDGAVSEMVWECVDTDFELLSDVISMFQTEIEKPWQLGQAPAARPVRGADWPSASGVSAVDWPDAKPTAAAPETDWPDTAKPAAGGYFDNLSPVDFDLLKKQSNILLGRMMVESGLISEPMLDEALKLQELVRDDKLSPLQACEALRKAYSRATPPSEQRKTTNETKRDSQIETAAIVDLLKQAGLVSEEDVKAVNEVRKKVGGDLGQILMSSAKVDKVVYQAALKAWPLVRDSKLKPEQAIIALHYCQRSRVDLREAFNDMGWDAPPEI